MGTNSAEREAFAESQEADTRNSASDASKNTGRRPIPIVSGTQTKAPTAMNKEGMVTKVSICHASMFFLALALF
jgi:hypothetical protein